MGVGQETESRRTREVKPWDWDGASSKKSWSLEKWQIKAQQMKNISCMRPKEIGKLHTMWRSKPGGKKNSQVLGRKNTKGEWVLKEEMGADIEP